MSSHRWVLLVAVVAGLLGALASFLVSGPGFLYGSDAGQRLLQGVLSATAPATPDGVVVARRGDRIPPLRLPGLDGRPMDLPGGDGHRPLLINFWASWCGPCIREMPELDRFARAQGGSGVQVVGIALDERDAVEAFLHRVQVGYPILLDRAGPADSSVRLGNPKGVLPYTVLVSADGRLVKQRVGPFEPGAIDAWARKVATPSPAP